MLCKNERSFFTFLRKKRILRKIHPNSKNVVYFPTANPVKNSLLFTRSEIRYKEFWNKIFEKKINGGPKSCEVTYHSDHFFKIYQSMEKNSLHQILMPIVSILQNFRSI